MFQMLPHPPQAQHQHGQALPSKPTLRASFCPTFNLFFCCYDKKDLWRKSWLHSGVSSSLLSEEVRAGTRKEPGGRNWNRAHPGTLLPGLLPGPCLASTVAPQCDQKTFHRHFLVHLDQGNSPVATLLVNSGLCQVDNWFFPFRSLILTWKIKT